MEVNEPALLVWMLLGGVASVISFILIYPSLLCIWHLAYAILDCLAIVVVLIGWLDDLTEDSMDWESESSPASTGQWTLICVASLLVVSLFLGVFFGEIMPCFDVPLKLYPLEVSEGAFLPFVLTVLGTFFSVVTGEEGMKITLSAIHKAYEHLNWQLPFALQPARLFANAVGWAPLHVWKGQYPLTFGISVFASGMIMDSASAQSGTILTNYFSHAIFNTIILIVSFLFAGLLAIKVI